MEDNCLELEKKIIFLIKNGYEVSDNGLQVTKIGTELNSSVNYAYELEIKKNNQCQD